MMKRISYLPCRLVPNCSPQIAISYFGQCISIVVWCHDMTISVQVVVYQWTFSIRFLQVILQFEGAAGETVTYGASTKHSFSNMSFFDYNTVLAVTSAIQKARHYFLSFNVAGVVWNTCFYRIFQCWGRWPLSVAVLFCIWLSPQSPWNMFVPNFHCTWQILRLIFHAWLCSFFMWILSSFLNTGRCAWYILPWHGL